MNILLIGNCSENFCKLIKDSKLTTRVYTANKNPLDNIANIEYQTIEELAEKAKVIKIDIAILLDTKLINENITEIFKSKRINLIAVNKKWYNLETSRFFAKQLVNYYSINTPKILKAPTTFPIILKTDFPNITHIASSIEDLIQQKEKFPKEKIFLEEYYDGKIIETLLLWDGKTLLIFEPDNLTEVQRDRLHLYKTKLNFLLSDEKADFLGFFISKLIWYKNDWHFIEFKMGINENLVIAQIKKDLIYLINSAIYQKLHEI